MMRVLARRGSGPSRLRASRLVSAPRLVSVVGELALVALLFLLGQQLPLVLALLGLQAPLLADDLGDLWVGEPRVLLHHLRLVVLAVKNEGWTSV
jgi:hypothetical protein